MTRLMDVLGLSKQDGGEGEGEEETGDIAGFDNGTTGSPLKGGRRRRKSLRRPKRRSRSNKRTRRHYGGKSQYEEEEEEEEEEEPVPGVTEDPNKPNVGGRMRRKGHRGKKTRGKVSGWIKHVLKFAKDNKMKYFQALKDKRCRATYKSHRK